MGPAGIQVAVLPISQSQALTWFATGLRMASSTAFGEKSDVGIAVNGLRTAAMVINIAMPVKADMSENMYDRTIDAQSYKITTATCSICTCSITAYLQQRKDRTEISRNLRDVRNKTFRLTIVL